MSPPPSRGKSGQSIICGTGSTEPTFIIISNSSWNCKCQIQRQSEQLGIIVATGAIPSYIAKSVDIGPVTYRGLATDAGT